MVVGGLSISDVRILFSLQRDRSRSGTNAFYVLYRFHTRNATYQIDNFSITQASLVSIFMYCCQRIIKMQSERRVKSDKIIIESPSLGGNCMNGNASYDTVKKSRYIK
jgi:hypothetical protein